MCLYACVWWGVMCSDYFSYKIYVYIYEIKYKKKK